MSTTEPTHSSVEAGAEAIRARVADELKKTLEQGLLLSPEMAQPRHSKVDHVVTEILPADQLNGSDEGLLNLGDLDDDARFLEFAQSLMRQRDDSLAPSES